MSSVRGKNQMLGIMETPRSHRQHFPRQMLHIANITPRCWIWAAARIVLVQEREPMQALISDDAPQDRTQRSQGLDRTKLPITRSSRPVE
jgi:hypothetical protein